MEIQNENILTTDFSCRWFLTSRHNAIIILYIWYFEHVKYKETFFFILATRLVVIYNTPVRTTGLDALHYKNKIPDFGTHNK